MTVQPLFEKFTHKDLTLANAFVMDHMSHSSAHDGSPELDVASLYRRRATYEVGLILSERAAIARMGATHDVHLPHFYGADALEGWHRVYDGVRRAGSNMAPKLWHMGNVARAPHGRAAAQSEGPSTRFGPGDAHQGGARMDAQAIADTIQAYAQAAKEARRLGFGAVELDAADGGLIDQFFWSVCNDRDDDYGGNTLKARSRFAQEVLRAMRQATDESMTLIVRLSQGKPLDPRARLADTCHEMEQWLTPLVDGGADILHCTQAHWQQPEFAGSPLNFAGWAKKITDLPVMTSGGVGMGRDTATEVAHLVERKERGEFDLIALDRALERDEGWVSRIKHGALEAVAANAPTARVHLVV